MYSYLNSVLFYYIIIKYEQRKIFIPSYVFPRQLSHRMTSNAPTDKRDTTIPVEHTSQCPIIDVSENNR